MIFHWNSCDPEDMVSLEATLRQFSFECKMKFTSVEEKLEINGTSFREALETDSFYLSSSAGRISSVFRSLILNSVLMKRTKFTYRYLWKGNVIVSNHHDQLSWRVHLSTKLFSQKDIHRKALKSAGNSWKVILSLFQLFLFLKDLTGNCWNETLKWLTGICWIAHSHKF